MKITRSWLKAAYGEKCKEYDDNCCVCRVWFLFEQLEQYYKMVSKHDMETMKKYKQKNQVRAVKAGLAKPRVR